MPNLSPNQYDIVALHNTDTEDFVFEYDKASGNYPYTIPAGEIRRFPRFLAAHALKHLVDKILTKRDIRTNNEEARAELMEQIVINEEVFTQENQKSEADVLKERIDTLNRPSELDALLAKRKEAPKEVSATSTTTPTAQKQEEKFEGLEPDKDDLPELDTTEKEVPAPPKEVPLMPTRQSIYAYAQTSLKMVLDKATLKKLDNMKIEELLTQVGDPRDKLA